MQLRAMWDAALGAVLVLGVGCTGPAGEQGPGGEPGQSGTSCSISENDDGTATILCSDGSSATVANGANGAPCSVVDNNDGTKTVTCPGSSPVTIANGADGADAQPCTVVDNTDGSKTITCPGSDPVTVFDGADGTSCTVTDNNDGSKTVSCPGSEPVTIYDGAPGPTGAGYVALEPTGVVGFVGGVSGHAAAGTVYFVPAADVAALAIVTMPVVKASLTDPNVDRDEPLEDLIRLNGGIYPSATLDADGVYALTSLPAGKYFVTYAPAVGSPFLPGGDACRIAKESTELVGTRLDIKVSAKIPAGAEYVGSSKCITCHGRSHISSTMHRLGIWSPYETGTYQNVAARRDDLYQALTVEFLAGTPNTVDDGGTPTDVTDDVETAAGTGGSTVYFSGYDAARGFDKYKTAKTQPANPTAPAAWLGGTAYALGSKVTNGGKMYEVTAAGTSDAALGATGPTGTGTGITDGGVTWKFVNLNVSFAVRVYENNGAYWMEYKNLEGTAYSLTRKVDSVYGGGVHKQRYQTRIQNADGSLKFTAMLPLQYNSEGVEGSTAGRGRTSQAWRDYYASSWYDQGSKKFRLPSATGSSSFEKNCVSCHAAGVQVTHDGTGNGADATNFFANTISDALFGDFDYDGDGVKDEMNVGCETCHGPGSKHWEAAGQGKHIVSPSLLTPERETMICGQCHSRPKGFYGSDNPVDTMGKMMVAGSSRAEFLAGHTATQGDGGTGDFWGAQNGNQSKSHHQQYSDFIRSAMYKNDAALMSCSSCHDPHRRDNARQLRVEPTDNAAMCTGCHAAQADLGGHTTTVIGTNHGPLDAKCTDCHMAKVSQSGAGAAPADGDGLTGASATKYWWGDISSHTFAVPRKASSLTSSPVGMPTAFMNPCGSCHGSFVSDL